MIRSRSILCITLLAALPAPAAPASLALGGQPVRVGDVLYVAPAVKLEPQAAAGTADCPAERTIPMIDGVEATGGAWPAAWPAGDHTAAVAVVDRCGRRTESAPLAFRVDALPPAVRWEAADTELFEDYGEPLAKRRTEGDKWDRRRERDRLREREEPRRRSDQRDSERTLAWSADGRGWIPLRGRAAGPDDDAPEPRIESRHPQVFLRGAATVGVSDGAAGELRLEDGQVLRLWAEDAESGVARLAVRRLDGPNGEILAVEAVDLVGNPVRLEWPLTTAATR